MSTSAKHGWYNPINQPRRSKTLFVRLLLALFFALCSLSLSGCGNNDTPKQAVIPVEPPAPVVPEKTPRQLYMELSHLQTTLKTMHDQHFLNYFKLESRMPQLPAPLVPEVRTHIIENVMQNGLSDRFIAELTLQVSDEQLKFMNTWLNSDLGKKANDLEMHKFLRPDVTLRKVNFMDLSASRQKLLAQYVETNKLTHLTITVLKLTKLAILEGIGSVTGQSSHQANTAVSSHERNLLFRELLGQYATILAPLSDNELAQLVKISQHPTYQKVHLAKHRALIVTFSHTAKGIGKILGEGSRHFPKKTTEPEPEESRPLDNTGRDKPAPPPVQGGRRGQILTYPIQDDNLGY